MKGGKIKFGHMAHPPVQIQTALSMGNLFETSAIRNRLQKKLAKKKSLEDERLSLVKEKFEKAGGLVGVLADLEALEQNWKTLSPKEKEPWEIDETVWVRRNH